MTTITFDELPPSAPVDNASYLQPTGFKLVIDRKNFPNLEYFAQSVVHPSLNLPASEQGYRGVDALPIAGDRLAYSELQFRVIMDENMNGYQEMIRWMERIIQVPARRGASALGNDISQHNADITLTVLSSANNPVRQIRYINAMPISVGEVMFEATVGDIQYITYDATFRFDYFQLI